MNIKRFLFAFVALFLFMFSYETLVHGFLLKNIYLETPTIWRDYNEMISYTPFNMVITALLALWITFIFTLVFKEGGSKNGLRFGLCLGILSGIQAAGAYFYLPISAVLATCWFTTYVVESIIGGYIIGLIYRK
ncbi:MAG: hypothetical protein NXI01_06735 [Gammaproteobacteria bacterium]|nr:hypothetical protein [Gammaproteobacteria bacterium]